MTGLVIAVSGKLRSGKTHLTRELSRQLGWPRVAFGEYVRLAVEQEGGDPCSRTELQDYGQSRIATDVFDFCRSVLGQIDYDRHTNIIVDGIRHVSVLEAIQQICTPKQTRLVYIECADETRYARARNSEIKEHVFTEQNQHPVELESGETLKNLANLIVSGEGNQFEVVQHTIENIRLWLRKFSQA